MLIENSEYVVCECCGKVKERIDKSQYRCDGCGAVMDSSGVIEMRVFYHIDNQVNHLHFCSWAHLFNHLALLQKDSAIHFVDFPPIGNESDKEQTISSLLDFINEMAG
jgi:predicted amidophosphoribosyltransferase